MITDLSDYENTVIEEMRNGFELEGLKLPWSKTHQDITLPTKYISILSGSSGNKKTTLSIQQLLYTSQFHKVGFASFEMRVNYLVRMMAAMSAGVQESTVGESCVREFAQFCKQRIFCFDEIGDVPANKVLAAVTRMGEEGCILVVVDSLMMVDLYARSAQEEYAKQRDFVANLSALAATYDMHIMLVAHNRKPGDHGDDYIPNKNSVRGSSGITDVAAVVLLAHSDQKKAQLLQDVRKHGHQLSDKEQQYVDRHPCQRLIVAKNRFAPFQGTIGLWQHTRSRQLLGDRADKGMRFGI